MIPFLIGRLRGATPEKTRRMHRIAAGMVLVLAVLYFAVYMYRAGDDGVRILPYQTFLFHEMPPILSERGIH